MSLKTSLLGLLLYGAMLLYASAFIAGKLSFRRACRGLFAAGFCFAASAWIWRGISTGHVPLQNLFEVFLAMGAMIYPIALACRRLPASRERADMLLGIILLWPAAFIFPETPRPLPPALQSFLFAPHVLVYLAAYVLLAKAAILAAARLRGASQDENARLDRAAHALAEVGYPFLTLGILLGAWWGKLAWGDYWHWDPKEMWALATWLIYTGYFHARVQFGRGPSRVGAVLLLAGFAAIVLTLSWVNLSRVFAGLHSYAM